MRGIERRLKAIEREADRCEQVSKTHQEELERLRRAWARCGLSDQLILPPHELSHAPLSISKRMEIALRLQRERSPGQAD